MQLRTAIEAFLLSYQGSKSEATVRWYRHRLEDLYKFLDGIDVERVSIGDLRRWRAGLERRGLAVRTRHGYVRAVRHFFKWLVEEGCMAVSPAWRLELPRLPKGEVKGISQADLKKMLDAARLSSARDYALCWVFYSTAGRLGGVVGLRISDLDLDHGRAMVCEKYAKFRPVFLLPEAVCALRAWLAQRPATPGDNHVFIGKRGPLSGSGVYQILKRLAEKADVGPGWNPHNWRHRRARDLLAANVPLSVVAQILGHSSVQVTADIYGVLPEDLLQEASKAVLPLFQQRTNSPRVNL